MSKITAYTAFTDPQPSDLLVGVDVSDTSMAPTGTDKKLTLAQAAAATQPPWQFKPEAYGAKGDGRLISDGSITASSNVLTSAGIPAAAAPALATNGSGGSILAGTYQVVVTYVNTYGESLPSASSSITTTGSASTITITGPVQSCDATGWYAYVTQLGGSTYTRQQVAPSFLGDVGGTFTLTAPPSSGGAAPPGADTSASKPFTAADVGKQIIVWAGPSSIERYWETGTITGFTDSAHVTVSFTASHTQAGTGFAYGTDDTAAIQAAVNAATAYALKGNGQPGEVVFSDVIYCVAGAAQIGGANMSNAQIVLPYVSSWGGQYAELRLTGAGMQRQNFVWNELPPQNGTILLSMRFDATIDGTYGYPFVIGGPVPPANEQSNMTLTVDKLNVMVPGYYAGTPTPYGGLGLSGILGMFVNSFSYLPLAVEGAIIVAPNPTWPHINGLLATKIPLTNIGIMAPVAGNLGWVQIGTYVCEWAQWGVVGGEHLTITNMFTYYCANGWAPSQGGHGASCLAWQCQACPYALDEANFTAGNQVPVFVGMLNLETWTAVANDPGAHLHGTVNFQTHDTSLTNYGNMVLTGANVPHLKLVSFDNNPGGITPPAVPATTVAFPNYFYRDATVYITSGGAAVTAIAVDATATGLTLGTSGTVAVRVPSGHSITLTYASTAPTWAWVLE